MSSFFSSLTIVESIWLWSLTGIGIALSVTKPAAAKTTPWPGWVRIAAACGAIVLVATALILAVPDAADQTLSEAVADKDFEDARSAYGTARAWSFGLPGYELFQSREMATMARALPVKAEAAQAWSLATEAAARADKTSEERFSAAYQCSVLAIVSGDLTRAEQKARESVALAPNWYKPHLLLGQILSAMGQANEGIAEQNLSVALGAKTK